MPVAADDECAGDAPHMRFPADAVIDVTQPPYEADPTGERDSTAALQKAIDDHTFGFDERYVLYLPNGTYRLTAMLEYKNNRNNNHASDNAGPNIIGESRDGVILKLDDNLPQFQDTDKPQPIISTIESGHWGNCGFMLSLLNFTLDTGKGNPAASGIRYIASNQGTLRHLRIRSGDPAGVGFAGIDMHTSTIPGPAMIADTIVEGFDYGVRIRSPHYLTVIEHLTVRNQNIAGILNHQHSLTVRKLHSDNTVPALISDHADGLVVLMDSDLQGSGDTPAIINDGHMLVMDVDVADGRPGLQHAGEVVVENDIERWSSSPAVTPPGGTSEFERMQVLETPDAFWDDPSTWVSAAKFIANPAVDLAEDNWNDDSAAVQKAIDSMTGDQRTLYFPPGSYKIGNTIELRGNVRRVVGMWSRVGTTPAIEQLGQPVLRIPADTDQPMYIDMFNYVPQPRRRNNTFLENHSKHDLTLRNVYVGHGKAYDGTNAEGRLFIEDVCSLSHMFYAKITGDHTQEALPGAVPMFDFADQEVWARQLNPEQYSTMVEVDGGRLWLMGIKTERPGTVIHAKSGAHVEVWGSTLMMVENDLKKFPAIVVEDSKVAMSLAEHAGVHWRDGKREPNGTYDVIVQEDGVGVVKAGDVATRGEGKGFVMPLYVSQ